MKNLPVFARLAYPDARSYPGRVAVELRQFIYAIKGCKPAGIIGKTPVAPHAWIAQQATRRSGTPSVFAGSPIFVPVPSSDVTPPRGERGAWAARGLVTALRKAGLGAGSAVLVQRTAAIESAKMARSRGQPRPTIAQHLATMAVTGELPAAPVVLVDDVLTRGTQLAACVELLRRAGYREKITGFCAGYWTSDTADPEQGYDGVVQWEGEGYANRTP